LTFYNCICFAKVGGVIIFSIPIFANKKIKIKLHPSHRWRNKETLVVCGLQVAILSEMMNSKRASEKLLTIYASFLGLGVLALLRGLLTCSSKSSSALGKRSALARKKRAWNCEIVSNMRKWKEEPSYSVTGWSMPRSPPLTKFLYFYLFNLVPFDRFCITRTSNSIRLHICYEKK